jgi:hypothetical protein
MTRSGNIGQLDLFGYTQGCAFIGSWLKMGPNTHQCVPSCPGDGVDLPRHVMTVTGFDGTTELSSNSRQIPGIGEPSGNWPWMFTDGICAETFNPGSRGIFVLQIPRHTVMPGSRGICSTKIPWHLAYGNTVILSNCRYLGICNLPILQVSRYAAIFHPQGAGTTRTTLTSTYIRKFSRDSCRYSHLIYHAFKCSNNVIFLCQIHNKHILHGSMATCININKKE